MTISTAAWSEPPEELELLDELDEDELEDELEDVELVDELDEVELELEEDELELDDELELEDVSSLAPPQADNAITELASNVVAATR